MLNSIVWNLGGCCVLYRFIFYVTPYVILYIIHNIIYVLQFEETLVMTLLMRSRSPRSLVFSYLTPFRNLLNSIRTNSYHLWIFFIPCLSLFRGKSSWELQLVTDIQNFLLFSEMLLPNSSCSMNSSLLVSIKLPGSPITEKIFCLVFSTVTRL